MRKKLWCYLLAFCMVLGLMPMTVLASDGTVSEDEKIEVGTEDELIKALRNTDNWDDGDTLEIILTKDITLTTDVNVKSTISYTLNIPEDMSLSLKEEGRIIYGGTKDFTIKGGGELFTNESINFSSIRRDKGPLTLENITVYCNKSNKWTVGMIYVKDLVVGSGATIQINAPEGGYGIDMATYGTILTVKDGGCIDIQEAYDPGIRVSGSANKPKIIIENGGTIKIGNGNGEVERTIGIGLSRNTILELQEGGSIIGTDETSMIRLSADAAVIGAGGLFSDQGEPFETDEEVTVLAKGTKPEKDQLTAGDYKWNGTLFCSPVIGQITITQQPQDTTVSQGWIEGKTLQMQAENNLGKEMTYQWYISEDGKTHQGDLITGATSNELQIPTDLTIGEYYYFCHVRAEDCDGVSSEIVKVTVVEAADYTAVYDALDKVPSNLNRYTADSVAKLKQAIDDVEYGLPEAEQYKVDAYAKAIEDAVNALVKRPSGGSDFFWNLTFDTNGGSKIDTITEWEYTTIDLDDYIPERDGYRFVGWYADEELTEAIDEVYLLEDTTVYAKWERILSEDNQDEEETEPTEPTENPDESTEKEFNDVSESDWYYDAVQYVLAHNIMRGMDANSFMPNTPLTREMLTVVLYNVAGQPESSGMVPFTDVKADMWYTDAIAWAAENDIVAGYDSTTFGLGDPVTREQTAAILYRYAQREGMDVSVTDGQLNAFLDAEQISDYATVAMNWNVAEGIMRGDGSRLYPQNSITRAEMAQILMKFLKL